MIISSKHFGGIYRIDRDSSNYTVQKIGFKKDKESGEMVENWSSEGFFSTLSGALIEIAIKFTEDGVETIELSDYVSSIKGYLTAFKENIIA